jgi:disulfide bond formation protein DsbB
VRPATEVDGGSITTETVTTFLALLALVAEAAVAVAVVLAVGRRWSSALDRAAVALHSSIGPAALELALAVAVVAMAGSLSFSEVAHFVPCKLCWYQRIAMYPLVPLLAVAVRHQDRAGARRYGVPIAVLGGLVSTYHVLLERFPSLETGACDPTNPCTLRWVERFGYLTIPVMAWSAFALIVTLLLLARPPDFGGGPA